MSRILPRYPAAILLLVTFAALAPAAAAGVNVDVSAWSHACDRDASSSRRLVSSTPEQRTSDYEEAHVQEGCEGASRTGVGIDDVGGAWVRDGWRWNHSEALAAHNEQSTRECEDDPAHSCTDHTYHGHATAEGGSQAERGVEIATPVGAQRLDVERCERSWRYANTWEGGSNETATHSESWDSHGREGAWTTRCEMGVFGAGASARARECTWTYEDDYVGSSRHRGARQEDGDGPGSIEPGDGRITGWTESGRACSSGVSSETASVHIEERWIDRCEAANAEWWSCAQRGEAALVLEAGEIRLRLDAPEPVATVYGTLASGTPV